MAIDTENKRRSTLCVLPKPDGAISLLDRMQVCWLYAGIEAGEVVVAFAAPQVHLFAARNRVDLSATNNRVDLEGCEDGR